MMKERIPPFSSQFLRIWHSLGARLTILFLLLSLVPLSIVGILAYRNSRRTIEAQQFSHLHAIGLLKGVEIGRWVQNNAQDLESLAQRPLVRAHAATLVQTDPGEENENATMSDLLRNHLLPALANEGGFQELFLIDSRNGRILAGTNEAEVGKYRENEPYYLQGRQQTYVQNVYYSVEQQEPLLTIGTPVKTEGDEVVAVLAGHPDLSVLTEMARQTSELTATEDTYLVNSFNFFVTDPRFGEGFALQRAVRTEGVENCLEEGDGRGFYEDYRGEPVLGAYHWMPEWDLCILTEIDQAEAFLPIADLRRSVLGTGALATLVVIVVGVYFTRSITSPLRQLVRGTERIGRGNLDYRIKVQSQDEIGQLAGAFNRMASNLQESIGETAHSRQLLMALSTGVQAVQKARTPNEVYRRVGEKVGELGFRAIVLLLTEDKEFLRPGYLGHDSASIQKVERLLGVSHDSYRIPLVPGGYAERVVRNKETLFLEPMSSLIAQMAPRQVQAMTGRVAKLLGMEQGIVAPLAVEEETLGIVIVTGNSLNEADISAVNVFASQTAIALKNAHLYEEARRSEARFRHLADAMPQLVWTARSEGTRDYYNQRRQELDGLEADRGAWQWKNVLHPADVEASTAAWQEALSSGEIFQVEERVRRWDGAYHWYLSRAVPTFNDQGQIVRWYGTSTDIQSQKEVEEALRRYREELEELVAERTAELVKSEARFRALFEAMPIPVLVTRANDGTILEANKHVKEAMGLPEGKVIGFQATDLYQDRSDRTRRIEEILTKGHVRNHELPIIRPDGVPRTLLISTTAIEVRGEQALLSGFLDVTERKEMEEALRRSNEELQRFAYVASHDLQEPLRMVTSFMQLLQQRYKGQLDETADEYIYFAVDGAKRMKELIDDLLDYSRVTTRGKAMAPVRSEQLLDSVMNVLKLVIEDSEATVTAGSLPTIMGDETQIRQLLQNLIGNAIKFRGNEPPRIRVAAEPSDEMWKFSVSDNGIGIDPQHAERIFAVFQRLHTKEEYEGTGIGLAICKKIVQRHGGEIWVESTPGEGSTFYFTLPPVPGDL